MGSKLKKEKKKESTYGNRLLLPANLINISSSCERAQLIKMFVSLQLHQMSHVIMAGGLIDRARCPACNANKARGGGQLLLAHGFQWLEEIFEITSWL